MKKYDRLCGLFWLVLAIFVVWTSISIGLGNFSYPGPGFFPLLIGTILGILSIVILILARKEKTKDLSYAQWPDFSKNVPTTMIALFVYAFLLEFLGYIVGSLLLMFFLYKVVSSNKWRSSITITLLVIFLTYVIFGVLLKSQFPKGMLGIG